MLNFLAEMKVTKSDKNPKILTNIDQRQQIIQLCSVFFYFDLNLSSTQFLPDFSEYFVFHFLSGNFACARRFALQTSPYVSSVTPHMISEGRILQPHFKTHVLTQQHCIATGPTNCTTSQSTSPLEGILKLENRTVSVRALPGNI